MHDNTQIEDRCHQMISYPGVPNHRDTVGLGHARLRDTGSRAPRRNDNYKPQKRDCALVIYLYLYIQVLLVNV